MAQSARRNLISIVIIHLMPNVVRLAIGMKYWITLHLISTQTAKQTNKNGKNNGRLQKTMTERNRLIQLQRYTQMVDARITWIRLINYNCWFLIKFKNISNGTDWGMFDFMNIPLSSCLKSTVVYHMTTSTIT